MKRFMVNKVKHLLNLIRIQNRCHRIWVSTVSSTTIFWGKKKEVIMKELWNKQIKINDLKKAKPVLNSIEGQFDRFDEGVSKILEPIKLK